MVRIAAAVAALLFVPAGHAATTTLGLYGEADRFRNLTGQRTKAEQVFPPWGIGPGRLDLTFGNHGPNPLVAVQTKRPGGVGEAITPRAISRGKGDGYLFRLNYAAHRLGSRAYIRPMPEMNGHWSMYCAYNSNGTKRGRSHSQHSFRDAFRRIYVIMKGGSRAEMNAKLARFDLPAIKQSLPRNPQVRVIWNPQGFGSPNVPGNMPAAYWPGKDFVDVVGNDLYDISGQATWGAAHRLYKQYPGKPYAFPEWGLWGIDDPGFIRQMRRWVDDASPSRAAGLVQRPGRLPLGSGLEAGEPQGLPALHHTARKLEPRHGRLR